MRTISLCTVLVLGLSVAMGQRAAAQAEAEKPKKVQIEEITVTAERREQSAQDIGVAIEAFSTEDLERQGITDIYELSSAVPSLQVTGGLPQPTLRGVSSDVLSFGVDAPFAAHINGQYVPNLAVALLPFLDMHRVEVLYGPQGTLFGHATTGGTLNFITTMPEADFGYSVRGDYASSERGSAEAVLNIPLVPEKVLSRIAFRKDWPSRTIDVEGGQNRAMSTLALPGGNAARFTLSLLPEDNVRIDLVGGWVYDDTTGGAPKRLDPYPAFPAGRSVLFNNFGASPNFSGATPNPRDPDEIRRNRRQSQDYTVGLAQALVSIDMNWATFKANSSYYSFDYYVDRDNDNSDADIQRSKLESFDVQWGQEFLLQSSTGNFVDWLLGVNYYEHRAPDTDVPLWDRQVDADAANFAIILPDLTPFTEGQPGGPFTPLSGESLLRAKARVKNRVWGLFGHTWINFTEDFRFVGGLRYSDTRRWFNDTSHFWVFQPPPIALPGVAVAVPLRGPGKREDEWDFLTFRAGFEFEPAEDHLLYANFSRGEQAGGFNYLQVLPVLDPTAPQGFRQVPTDPLDTEKIYAWEGGYKSQFLDSRLQLNLSGYYYTYKDKFVTNTITTGFVETTNAPKAIIYGGELSTIYLPTDELRLNGALGLIHSEYTEDFVGVNGSLYGLCMINAPCNPATPTVDLVAPFPEENAKGNQLNRAPAVTVTLGAEYAFALGDWGFVTPRVDYYWRDKVYFTQFNDRATSQGSYGRTDARVRVEPVDGRYWLELYCNNIEDNDKIRTQLEGGNSNPAWWLEEPRVFGIRFGYNYE